MQTEGDQLEREQAGDRSAASRQGVGVGGKGSKHGRPQTQGQDDVETTVAKRGRTARAG